MLLSEIRSLVTVARTMRWNITRARLAESFCNQSGDHSKAVRFLSSHSGMEFSRCDRCGAAWPEDNFFEARGDMVCPHCYELRYFSCYSCAEVFNNDCRMEAPNGHYHCESCYDDSYRSCDDCGEAVDCDEIAYENDGAYCEDCIPSERHIKSYSSDIFDHVKKSFLFAPNEKVTGRNKALFLGWELEVICKESRELSRIAETVDGTLSDCGILKEDSSIRGTGFEVVSTPATLAYHQTQWGGTLAALQKHCRGWDQDSCGMHVHIDRHGLTNAQIGRMAFFLNAPENDIFIRDIAGRSRNTYCKALPKKITCISKYGKYRDDYSGERYQALNLQNDATVEVRIFQSNVATVGFLKNIEFCDAMARWCRDASNAALGWVDFLLWVDTPSRRAIYPNLSSWLVRGNYIKRHHHAKPGTIELPAAA